MTKKYKNISNIFGFLSFIATVGPLLTYIIIGFINASPKQGMALSMCVIVCIIFTLINLIFKHRIRCTMFILLMGLYVSVGNLIPLLITMFITTALDEFVFVPIHKKYKNLFVINKEIDKRHGNMENKA